MQDCFTLFNCESDEEIKNVENTEWDMSKEMRKSCLLRIEIQSAV